MPQRQLLFWLFSRCRLVLPILELYINGIMHTVQTALRKVSFTQNNVFETDLLAPYISSSFLCYGWGVFHCMNIPHFTHPPTDRHLGSFQFRAIKINMLWPILQKSFGEHTFSFLLSNCRGLELLSECMLIFIRKYQTFIPTSCTILLSHQKYMKIPVTPYSQQQLILSIFVFLAILLTSIRSLWF